MKYIKGVNQLLRYNFSHMPHAQSYLILFTHSQKIPKYPSQNILGLYNYFPSYLPKLGHNIHHKKAQSLTSYPILYHYLASQNQPYEPNTYISFYSNQCPKNHDNIYIKSQDYPCLAIFIPKPKTIHAQQYLYQSSR